MSIQTIQTGTYVVEAPCPRCGVVEEMLVGIRSVLSIPLDDIGSLKVQLKGKALDHDCRQTRLTDARDAGLLEPPRDAVEPGEEVEDG